MLSKTIHFKVKNNKEEKVSALINCKKFVANLIREQICKKIFALKKCKNAKLLT